MRQPINTPENIALIDKLVAAGKRDYLSLDLSDMAKITRVKKSVIERYFRDLDEWIDAFFCLLVDQYREMLAEVPDFERYTVGEKLSNFCFTSMDMMRDHEKLVYSTYDPFILNRYTTTRFEQSVQQLFRDFTEQDGRIAMTNQLFLISPVYTFWSREYIHIIGYWLSHPEAEEQTIAFIEKTTSLLNEILYNGVLDKGIDLGKFLVENRMFPSLSPINILKRYIRF